MQRFQKLERDAWVLFYLRSFRPKFFVVRFDDRAIFGQSPLEADVSVHVAVGEMVDDLTRCPTAGAVSRVELLRGKCSDERLNLRG